MKKFVLLAIITFCVIPFAAASDTDDVTSVPSGIPISELEQFIDNFAAEHIGIKTAGAAIAVVKDGELIFNKAFGYAVQDEVKADTDSVFEWGSATKLLIWTSVMQLVEQGRLDLNADIRDYLPNNFLKKLRYETPITMYNLMHHNAGWEDRVVDLFYGSARTVPNLEGSLLAYEPRQIFPPGTIVAYSNFGTAIAGFIVERISGKPFHEYVWENIFTPLGMNDTSIHPLQNDNPSVAERREQIKGHTSVNERPVVSGIERIYIGLYPAGSVIGTAQDAAKFLAALMPADGETSILFSDNSILNEMLSSSHLFREGFPRFAHGFMEYYSAVRALGHGGNTAAFSSLFTFAPQERFALVILTNQAGETALCSGLTRALFGEYIPPLTLEEFPDANNLAGLFVTARRPAYGFMNLLSSLTFFPTKPIDKNTLDVAGAKLVQISPYLFKNTGGNDQLNFLDFIFFETENDPEHSSSVTRISINYFDFLPAGSGKLLAVNATIILMVLCLLYMFAAVIISIIGAIKNKKKGIPSNIVKKLNIVLYSSMAAVIINNVILVLRFSSFVTYSSLLIHFIFNILYAIFVPVCIGFMIVKWKKVERKSSKVFIVFSMVTTLIFAVLLITWGFWY